jgi:WD40 repeat protein
LLVYEPGTGKWLHWRDFSSAGWIYGMAFSPDSRRVALACHARCLLVLDFQTNRGMVYHGHTMAVSCVAFSPDGSRLASGSLTGELRLWDASSTPDATTWTASCNSDRLAYSPDSSLLALGMDLRPTGPAVVRLVDVATGKTRRTLTGPHSSPASLAFSPDGRLLAALWKDRSITLWEVSSGQLRHRLRGAGAGPQIPNIFRDRIRVGFSSDGKEVLMGSDVLQVWDVQTGRELRRWPLKGLPGPAWAMAFSPGCRHFATATLHGTVQFWDPVDGKEIARLTGPFAPHVLTFDRAGARLAVAAWNPVASSLVLYDIRSGKEVRSFAGHADMVNWLDFSPDGARLASGSNDNTVKLWDVASGQELLSLGGHDKWARAGGFSPDGLTLASADGARTIRLWRGARRREVFTWANPGLIPLGLAYSPDGRRLAHSGVGAQAVVRDTVSGRRLFTVGQTEVKLVDSSLAFRPDGQELALGLGNATGTGEIEIWDLARRARRHRLVGLGNAPVGLAYSPDGQRLASANHDRTAVVWDLDTGKRLVTFLGHRERVNGVAFSPDGKRVASAGRDGTVRVWDSSTGEELLRLPGPRGAPGTFLLTPDPWSALLNLRAHVTSLGGVVWSPDGNRLAACGLSGMPANRVVMVWDARTGQEVLTLRGHKEDIYRVAYRPDGKVLASASRDRTVRLWDAVTGKPLLTLTGHDGTVYRLAFSPDGKRLVSSSFEGSVRVWDVADVGPGK